MKLERAAGVLLHPTALPGPGGIGSIGSEAFRFVDWLAAAGQSYWQILPVVAVDEGGSPYNALSAMAGNPLLIDLAALADEGLLAADELRLDSGEGEVDFQAVARHRERVLTRAYEAFAAGAAPHLRAPFERYRSDHEAWLHDYALFRALRTRYGGAPWTSWDEGVRLRDPAALEAARRELADEMSRREFAQFVFDRQWMRLRAYARERGVRLIGDVPIFVAHDSADVWADREIFRLDRDGRPRVVSGVPPDYFSETGQRWGNPLYDWERVRERGYAWWIERFRRTLQWVDVVRVDHFRGFQAYWEIPADEDTAIRGRWREGPGRELFDRVRRELGDLPLIAEDLGLITPEVEALRDELDLPGMRVLQFGFDGDPRNPHLPENYPENAVGYTGTHDNDTLVGWWEGAPEPERSRARERIAGSGDPTHWALIGLVLGSRAGLSIVPAQDLLGLGSEARMNTPGTSASNWSWRLRPGQLTEDVQARLMDLTRRSDRIPDRPVR